MFASLRMRPRVRLTSRASNSDIARVIRSRTADPAVPFQSTATGSYVVIQVPDDRQHLWSPQLQFEITEGGDGSVLEGLFMPPAPVWTAFAGLYGLILFAGFFGTMFGLAQLQLGWSPVGLLALPVSLVLLATVYGAALVGQRWGLDQMHELSGFLAECINQAETQGGVSSATRAAA